MTPRLFLIFLLLFAFTIPYPENPPVAHTGGFGEPSCHACHFEGDLNDGIADLSVLGIKSNYIPAESYQINIALKREHMERAGFQLSMRDSSGHQAGTLSKIDKRVAIDVANGIQYVRHTPEGTTLVHEDSTSWAFTWVAPDSVQAVYLHLSTNAANGDESEFGDAVYQIEHVITAVD